MNERLPGAIIGSEPAQYRALLEVTESIAVHHDLAGLFRDLLQRLPRIITCSSISMALHNPDRNTLQMHILEHVGPGPLAPGMEQPVEDVPGGWVLQHQEPLVCTNVDQETRFPKVMPMVRLAGIKSFCVVPLTTARRRLGAMGVGSEEEHHYEGAELDFLQQVAKQVAVAVENTLNFERAHQAEEDARRRFERERLMLEINNAVVSQLDLRELVRVISSSLCEALEINAVGLSLYEPESACFRVYYYDLPDTIPPMEAGATIPAEGSIGGLALTSGRPILINRASEAEAFPESKRRFYDHGFNAGGCVPLIMQGRKLGVLGLLSFREDAFPKESQQLLCQIADQIAIATENALNFERARQAEEEAQRRFERERLMLEINNAVVSQLDLGELLKSISACLHRVIPHDLAAFCIYDAATNQLRGHSLDFPSNQGFGGIGDPIPLEGTPEGMAFTSQKPVLIKKLSLVEFSAEVVKRGAAAGLKSGCAVPLLAHGRALGTLSVVSLSENAFSEQDAELLGNIGTQVAIAVENTLNFESAQAAKRQFMKERDRLRLLIDVANNLTSNLELRDLLQATVAGVRRVMQCDLVTVHLPNPERTQLQTYVMDFFDSRWTLPDNQWQPVEGTLEGKVFRSGTPIVAARLDSSEFPREAKVLQDLGIVGGCIVPLLHRGQVLGNMGLGRKEEIAYTAEEVDFLMQFGTQVAIAIENAVAYGQIADLKDKLAQEKLYLEDEIRSDFEEIVGESAPIKQVLKQVGIVAPTDSTVLILGETGTGKELLARAIHDRSKRREGTFVKLNCAAIPTGLLESELFGHEKGAFTGAIATKVGRFELADGGTLFLDEVGDIPLELQSKLLRVLQEQEFERLGSTRTIKVKVRLLAATNRDLLEMVEQKQFRSDLYYRLNVFPIVSPSLRERAGDIPLLVRYFTQRLSRQMEKRVERIPSDTMDALCRYRWPGNVRELENLIERAVILSQGTELTVPLGELKIAARESPSAVATLHEAERDHILRALQESNWVIAGPSGAATLLGMKRSTLQSKMIKLGISRRP
jgi:formate hydrogenlyase transcriptional activator